MSTATQPDSPIADPSSTPIVNETAHLSSLDTEPSHWSLWTHIGFRFAFCYLGTYCLCNGNSTVFLAIPGYGYDVQDWFASIFLYPAQYLAQHLFHVPPPGNTLHLTTSGDTALDWIAQLLMLVLSFLATAVWSILDRQRPHYKMLSAWLRFVVRITLILSLVVYGIYKVLPVQMPRIPIMWLNEPTGMHPPMTMLWMLIGSSPIYEGICGCAELLAGVLLLFRRTALFGALLASFVLLNVLLDNLFFDVPVKIYAAHLLFFALFLTLPDAGQLFRFFWLHQPAVPMGLWTPPANQLWFRRTILGVEIALVLLRTSGVGYETINRWRTGHDAWIAPCPWRGVWRIDSATLPGVDGAPIQHPVLSSDDRTFVELEIDEASRAAFQDEFGKLSYFQTRTDVENHTLQLVRPQKPPITAFATITNLPTITYSVATPKPRHLILTPTGSEAKSASTLALTLVTPPGGYLLLTRGFHWVTEYSYER